MNNIQHKSIQEKEPNANTSNFIQNTLTEANNTHLSPHIAYRQSPLLYRVRTTEQPLQIKPLFTSKKRQISIIVYQYSQNAKQITSLLSQLKY